MTDKKISIDVEVKKAKHETEEAFNWIADFLKKNNLLEVIAQYNILLASQISLSTEHNEYPTIPLIAGIGLRLSEISQSFNNDQMPDLFDKNLHHFRKLSFSLFDPSNSQNELVRRAKMQGLIKQTNPNLYEHQIEDYKIKVLDKISDLINDTCGFTTVHYFLFDKRIRDLIEDRFEERRKNAISEVEKVREEYKNNKDNIKAEIDVICSARNISLTTYFEQLQTSFVFYSLQDIFKITIVDIATSDEEIEAFKNIFKKVSCKLGENANFVDVFSENIVLSKPLINLDDETYFVAIPSQLYKFSHQLFELFLENEKEQQTKKWHRYLKIKSDFVVNNTVEYLKRVFPASSIIANPKYKLNGDIYEVDVLLDYCGKLFVFEAKSPFFTKSASRGGIERLKTDLKKTIVSAYNQGKRFKNHLKDHGKIYLNDSNGNLLRELVYSSFDEIIISVITLEPLLDFATSPAKISELLDLDPNLSPWVANVYDLDLITEFLPLPSLVHHYLSKRTASADRNLLFGIDEICYLSSYLNDISLNYSEDQEDKVDMVFLDAGFIQPFDDYYVNQGDKPKIKMNPYFSKLIQDLDNQQTSGYLNLTRALLDQGIGIQDLIIKNIDSLYEKFEKKRSSTDLSFLFTNIRKEKIGISIFLETNFELLSNKMPQYCYIKKYQTKANKWIGIGLDTSDRYQAVMYYLNESPWIHNNEDEKILKKIFTK